MWLSPISKEAHDLGYILAGRVKKLRFRAWILVGDFAFFQAYHYLGGFHGCFLKLS